MSHRIVCLVLFLILACGWSAAQSENLDPRGRMTDGPDRILGPVLLVDGDDTPEANAWFHAAMDSFFGVGNWDSYHLPEQGLPDPPELLMSLFGQYQGIVWHCGSEGMADLRAASWVLNDFLTGSPSPGKLFLVAPYLYSHLQQMPLLAQEGLGLYPVASPLPYLGIPAGSTTLAHADDLENLYNPEAIYRATGIQPLDGTEILYQMEFCMRCYSVRPPFDPVVAVRFPDRQTALHARAITLTLPLQSYPASSSWHLFSTLMKFHLGFVSSSTTSSGESKVRLSINNAGYVGNFFAGPEQPSLVYPYPSYVEHLYHGGIWVGARLPDGQLRVSTSADCYNGAAVGEERREFIPTEEEIQISSNIPGSENYDPSALAPWQLTCSFKDQVELENHTPLDIKILLRAMSWNSFPLDDGVVLEYRVVNESGQDLQDVYFGFFMDSTVGNTQATSPYYGGPYPLWNYYDDVNGGWQPGDLADDPTAWMMWEHDDDGENGLATSWLGCRLLSIEPSVTPPPLTPPVSYNAYRFNNFPLFDDTYWDEEDQVMLPGRYQIMGNGDFDAGVTPDGDFTIVSDWLGLLSTGPVSVLATGDTLKATYALVCGDGEWELMRNSRRFAEQEENGYVLEASPVAGEIPQGIHLGRAIPNPFNPSTEISFTLDRPGWTRLEVFNMAGRRVKILQDGNLEAGTHRSQWDGCDAAGQRVSSGVYYYRLSAPGGSRLVGQLTLVK